MPRHLNSFEPGFIRLHGIVGETIKLRDLAVQVGKAYRKGINVGKLLL
jgi:hypothetical protein